MVRTVPFWSTRRTVAIVEGIYAIVLLLIGLVYLATPDNWLRTHIPATLGMLPIGVPWFGALGAVTISLAGTIEHRTDWDASWSV